MFPKYLNAYVLQFAIWKAYCEVIALYQWMGIDNANNSGTLWNLIVCFNNLYWAFIFFKIQM